MKKFKYQSIFEGIFSLVVIGDLIGRYQNSQTLDIIFKPLLLPLLIIFFWVNLPKQKNTFAYLILLGLFFSWFGDVMLIFEQNAEIFFILGLGGFLLAHIFYIIAYHKGVSPTTSTKPLLRQKPYLMLPFVVLLVGLYSYLFPHLGELQIPVLVYSITILLMAIFALNRYGRTTKESFAAIMIGAFCFIISDSCLAVSKFVMPIEFSGIIIMITYIQAQYFIVRGAIFEMNQ